ncbi:MAG: histidine kinase, partial [Pseudomonadales bacterium]|nr:histidine kinase [Pseudomonadales bacterium]
SLPIEQPHPLIPDLCRLPVVLSILAVTQLLVIIYVLSLGTMAQFDWELLSLLSPYAQWIGMLSLAGLCNLRYLINRLAMPHAILASFAIILLVVMTTNGLAQWVYYGLSWDGWSAQWLFRDVLIIAVIAAIALRYLYIQQQWLLEQSATNSAKLDALHARIRPHFLFNSMNTIASLIRFAPTEAEKAVEDLAALMRATLSSRQLLGDWQQELEICQAYARIEQLRMGERLQLRWEVADVPSELMLPPLVLQPLLENAIYHGIEKLPEGGVVRVAAHRNNDVVMFTVTNPRVPHELVDMHKNSESSRQDAQHNGLALDNIRARLASLFRDSASGRNMASLDLTQSEHEFIATLSIPLHAD